jgi:hypothetical protein
LGGGTGTPSTAQHAMRHSAQFGYEIGALLEALT